MALNFRYDDSAGHDKSCANPMSRGQVLTQEKNGQNIAATTLSLSTGATLDASPSCKTRK